MLIVVIQRGDYRQVGPLVSDFFLSLDASLRQYRATPQEGGKSQNLSGSRAPLWKLTLHAALVHTCSK